MNQENSIILFKVEAVDANKRLDIFLAEKIEGWSRSRLRKLIEDGEVLVNEKAVRNSHKLKTNDEIEIELVEQISENFIPEDIPLDIIFEDTELAVINKPSGMIVHPGAGVKTGTLANAIAHHFKFQTSNTENNYRIGIVHRLDKETSGLIVVAKNEQAHEKISEQFRERTVFKSYLALVHGETDEDSGKIELPIGRDRINRLKMTVTQYGRNALSLWKTKERFDRFTLLDVEIKTGRTHQIRVHLAAIKHGVVGDILYNGGRDNNVPNVKIRHEIPKLNRFFLHAEKLSFTHPTTGKNLSFQADLPKDLSNFLEKIR